MKNIEKLSGAKHAWLVSAERIKAAGAESNLTDALLCISGKIDEIIDAVNSPDVAKRVSLRDGIMLLKAMKDSEKKAKLSEQDAERKAILAASDYGPVNPEEWAAAIRGDKWPIQQDGDSEAIKMGYKASGWPDIKGAIFNGDELILGSDGQFKGEFGDKVREAEKQSLIEYWSEPSLNCIECNAAMGPHKKADLLIRMQSWADFYNKKDGFVADWSDNSKKWGIDINDGKAEVGHNTFMNTGLFQISVGSEERSNEMLKYFLTDINALIKSGSI